MWLIKRYTFYLKQVKRDFQNSVPSNNHCKFNFGYFTLSDFTSLNSFLMLWWEVKGLDWMCLVNIIEPSTIWLVINHKFPIHFWLNKWTPIRFYISYYLFTTSETILRKVALKSVELEISFSFFINTEQIIYDLWFKIGKNILKKNQNF